MKLRLACAGIAAALALAGCGAGGRPNFIYIMTDDHAAHMLSAYGSAIASTPNLDRIADGGMLFENAFVTNSLCAPSRAVLLSGKYSHRNGQLSNRDTFDGSQQTFPKLMREAGYETALIGKWHLKSDPAGFDYWKVLPGQGRYHDPEFIEMGKRVRHEGYVTDLITDFVLQWLENRPEERPFLLLYHHKAPHGPWEPDEKHRAMFAGETIAEPPHFHDDFSNRASAAAASESDLEPELAARYTRWGSAPPPELDALGRKKWVYQRYVKDYMRVVASVDDNVGRLLDYLDAAGLAANTAVIYTSDNGMFVGDHGLFDKRFMYEEPLRVPLLVRYPPIIRPGSRTAAMALNLDFAPTILDLAGIPVPEDMQGRSLQPVLRGGVPGNWRKSAYYHYYEYPSSHNVYPHYGVHTERYKLIHYYKPVDEWEMFDIEEDPLELRSVYDDPQYAQVRAELEAELARLRAELQVTEE